MNVLDMQKGNSSAGIVEFYNDILVTNGAGITNAHIGGSGTWTVPQRANTITFHAWSGGGAGAGHCCHSCLCDILTCPSHGGYYSRKTVCREAGDFLPGDTYAWCYGEGGNGSYNLGCGCNNACCDAPRGCRSYVTGPGLSNFCAPGGRGGYVRYCTNQGGRNSACWSEMLCDLGICLGVNVDFASVDDQPFFSKANDVNNYATRMWKTGQSYGLNNSHAFEVECGYRCCGIRNCKAGPHLIAMGGSSHTKSQCAGYNCCCLGGPGHPGMIRIEWS